MEYNKSLSARIKRRNKQGFEGIGNYHGISPYPHPYGDYTDPNQNHKNTEPNHIANQASALCQIGRHKGSKPIKRLKRLISQLDSRHYWEERLKRLDIILNFIT